ncbi:MAG: hypothetical protein MRJ96_00705 [Nitrospirales bacterium]|nr:hypothetical protein [Nitrospirales bacterium]
MAIASSPPHARNMDATLARVIFCQQQIPPTDTRQNKDPRTARIVNFRSTILIGE